MKDAYTLDSSWEGLDVGYGLHDKAYRAIFDRCNLDYFVVGASSGAMGGTGSEEFMVKSDAGEDTVAHCRNCGYAGNLEVAESRVPERGREKESEEVKEIATPDVHSIDELCEFLKIKEIQCAKSRVYINDGKPVLVLMLGNEEVNETKLAKALGGNIRPAHAEELKDISGADAGSIGPIGFNGKIIADNRLRDANNLYSGANKNDYHFSGIDLKRDVKTIEYFDLRSVQSGEECIKCGNKLDVFSAIELGHIFKLGTKYSNSMGAKFLDENGEEKPIIMGSYGIGVERVMACYIEQHNDENGLVWDKTLTPFHVHLMGLNMKKNEIVQICDRVYNELNEKGIEVLYDDRVDAQAGFKFKDADLLGMPLQIIVGDKKLKENKVEVKIRKSGERFDVKVDELIGKVQNLLK
jgi:prolyl-tRNA synthetase